MWLLYLYLLRSRKECLIWRPLPSACELVTPVKPSLNIHEYRYSSSLQPYFVKIGHVTDFTKGCKWISNCTSHISLPIWLKFGIEYLDVTSLSNCEFCTNRCSEGYTWRPKLNFAPVLNVFSSTLDRVRYRWYSHNVAEQIWLMKICAVEDRLTYGLTWYFSSTVYIFRPFRKKFGTSNLSVLPSRCCRFHVHWCKWISICTFYIHFPN
jgi:hypothetical protein